MFWKYSNIILTLYEIWEISKRNKNKNKNNYKTEEEVGIRLPKSTEKGGVGYFILRSTTHWSHPVTTSTRPSDHTYWPNALAPSVIATVGTNVEMTLVASGCGQCMGLVCI